MNRLYLYGILGWDWSAIDVINQLDEIGDNADVTLHIHSPGGLVDDAIAIVSTLRRRTGRVECVIDGLCASAATLIAACCEHVVASEIAEIMTHAPWTWTSGDVTVHQESIETLQRAERLMLSIYAARMGDDPDLLSEERWYTAAEALEAGLVDEVETQEAEELESSAALITRYAAIAAEFGMPTYGIPAKGEDDMARPNYLTRPPRAAASPPVAAAPVAAPPAPAEPAPADVLAAERERCAAIVAMCERHGVPADQRDAYLTSGTSTAAVSASVLDWLAEQAVPAPVPSTTDQVPAIDRIAVDARNALAARLGREPVNPGNRLVNATLLDLVRVYDTQDGYGGPMAMIDRVLGHGGPPQTRRIEASVPGTGITHTTSDFAGLMGDAVLSGVLQGNTEVATQIDTWTPMRSTGRLGEQTLGGLGQFPDLQQLVEGGQYEFVSIAGRSASFDVATYGNMFGITRQALINDDLGVFDLIPQRQGQAVRRTQMNHVLGILQDNPVMSDSEQLFSAAHANTQAAGLSETSLEIALGQISAQKDDAGELIGARGAYLIVPPALEYTAKRILAGTIDGDPNVLAGSVQVLVEPFLTSTTIWYVATGPTADHIARVYLNGVQTPHLEQQIGWNIDGIEFKVRIDFAAALLGYRGIARGGTSP